MDETNEEVGLGHNLDPDGESGLEAIRDYDISVAKEQVVRDDAIAAAVRCGNALIKGRSRCKTNNEFGDWIKAQGLDRHRIFSWRQERQAAMQIAEIVAHVARETVDSTTAVNPFAHCPNNRPTHTTTWWRGKHPNLLTMAHAKAVGERAAKILRDHRNSLDEYEFENLEALERDPYPTLMLDRSDEDILNDLEVRLGLRPAPKDEPKPQPADPDGLEGWPDHQRPGHQVLHPRPGYSGGVVRGHARRLRQGAPRQGQGVGRGASRPQRGAVVTRRFFSRWTSNSNSSKLRPAVLSCQIGRSKLTASPCRRPWPWIAPSRCAVRPLAGISAFPRSETAVLRGLPRSAGGLVGERLADRA
jgi:hypothetical protein